MIQKGMSFLIYSFLPAKFELIRALESDKSSYVRGAAAIALAKIQSPAAIDQIKRKLKKENIANSRAWMYVALLDLGYKKQWVLSELLKLFRNKKAAVRVIVVKTLSRFNNSSSKKALIDALNDKNSFVRTAAIKSLGVLKDKGAINSISDRLLNDKNELVRIEAAESLGEIGSIKAENALLSALKNDKSDLVRSYTAESLAFIKSRKAIKTIKASLKNEKKASAKVGMYSALYILGDGSVLPKLKKCIFAEDYHVRCAAANILADFVDEENKEEITRLFLNVLKKEKTIAVKSTIREILDEIKKEE